MFEEELNFFIANQDELVAKHKGQVLVLRGRRVLGAYSSALEAFLEARKDNALGTFMIQPCESGEEAYTVTANPNYVFK